MATGDNQRMEAALREARDDIQRMEAELREARAATEQAALAQVWMVRRTLPLP